MYMFDSVYMCMYDSVNICGGNGWMYVYMAVRTGVRKRLYLCIQYVHVWGNGCMYMYDSMYMHASVYKCGGNEYMHV